MTSVEERAVEMVVIPFQIIGKKTNRRLGGLINRFIFDCLIKNTGKFELEVDRSTYGIAQIGQVCELMTSFCQKYGKDGKPIGERYLRFAPYVRGEYMGIISNN